MFKAIPYIVKLHMCKHVDHRVNRVAHFCQSNPRLQKPYSQVQERDPCQQPDPCPPPPKDDRAFWGAMAILFTMGCFGVYAKHTPEVRDWLSIYATWFDDLIAAAYQENMTYADQAKELKAAVLEFLTKPEPPKLCDSEGNLIRKPKKEKKPEKLLDMACRSKDSKGKEDKTVKDKCPEPRTPPTVKDVCEIQACLQESGMTCLNNYWTAKEACKVYNELVEQSLNVTNFSAEKLKALRPAMLERFRLLNEHVCAAERALRTIDLLDRMMKSGVNAPKEVVDNTNAMLKEVTAKIKVMQTDYIWEADRAVSLDAQWQIVEKQVNKYMKENQTMFPETVYDSEKPLINSSNTDLLLIHTIKYKKWLETVLKAVAEAASARADRGVEALSQDGKTLNQLIQVEYKKKQASLDQWYKERLDWQKKEYDKLLKKSQEELKQRHERQLAVNLVKKEEEATKKLEKLVKEEVEAQKNKFARELRDMSLKVKAVQDKLNVRLKIESEAKRSQQLWSVGSSIIAATKKGEPRVCVRREIRALEAATGDGDKFVETVIKSIPEAARTEGLVPESVLRERFYVMEKTARDVALVEQEGSPMPVYIFSWIQSQLLFMKPSGIPQEYIDNPVKTKKQLEDFDTFDRLNYARYWIEQGNLAHALCYVNSLEGASRVAADPWYKDAKAHVELKQAAEAVIAHATAIALQYI